MSESNRNIYCSLNRSELEKYASLSANIDLPEWLFFKLCKSPRKATTLESYFHAVTDLAILLRQDPTTGVFMESFHNFENRYFYTY